MKPSSPGRCRRRRRAPTTGRRRTRATRQHPAEERGLWRHERAEHRGAVAVDDHDRTVVVPETTLRRSTTAAARWCSRSTRTTRAPSPRTSCTARRPRSRSWEPGPVGQRRSRRRPPTGPDRLTRNRRAVRGDVGHQRNVYYWKAVYTSGDAQHKDVTSCTEATTFTSLANGSPVTSP